MLGGDLMAAVLGFKDGEYVAYFSCEKYAKEEGCNLLKEIPNEYIGEGGIIFLIKCTVETFFDDTLEYVELTKSCEDSLKRFKDFTSSTFMKQVCDEYLASLTDEEKADIGQYIDPYDVIMEISLMNMVAYPDEY
jgi:hypothetical protein